MRRKNKGKNVVNINVSELKTGMGILVGNIFVFKEPGVLVSIHVLNEDKMEEGIRKIQEEYKLEKIV